eukprot:INCI6370.2.p1 GENE.INCI6370.2~~INCI6370.2.p1  ORF type:complete len:1896 (-),score=245.23 INCI6370.2:271-5958(-)
MLPLRHVCNKRRKFQIALVLAVFAAVWLLNFLWLVGTTLVPTWNIKESSLSLSSNAPGKHQLPSQATCDVERAALQYVYGWNVSLLEHSLDEKEAVERPETEVSHDDVQVVVLGMHHSGTSIATRLLMDTGLWAGRPPVNRELLRQSRHRSRTNVDNPEQAAFEWSAEYVDLDVLPGKYAWKFWELRPMVALNEQVFAKASASAYRDRLADVSATVAAPAHFAAWTGIDFNPSKVGSDQQLAFRQRAKAILQAHLDRPANTLKRLFHNFSSTSTTMHDSQMTGSAFSTPFIGWVAKDPRMSLALQLWKPLLPEMRCVILTRDAWEVASGLAKRYGETGTAASNLSLPHFLWLWEYYLRTILFNCLDTPTLFVSHSDMVRGMSEMVENKNTSTNTARKYLSAFANTVHRAFQTRHHIVPNLESHVMADGLHDLLQHLHEPGPKFTRPVERTAWWMSRFNEIPNSVFIERASAVLARYEHVFRGKALPTFGFGAAAAAANDVWAKISGSPLGRFPASAPTPSRMSVKRASHEPLTGAKSSINSDVEGNEVNAGGGGDTLTFFWIWTTAPSSFLELNRRCLESIFFHHQHITPPVRVRVYSPTLPLDFFQEFARAGYDVEVVRIDPAVVTRDALPNFPDFGTSVAHGRFFFSHTTDVLRVYLLYKFGGIYLDTDVVVLNPLDRLPRACLGFQYDAISAALRPNAAVNGAVMVFRDHGHPFLAAVLDSITPQSYDINQWAVIGPALLTSVLNAPLGPRSTVLRESWNVDVLPVYKFYPLDWRRVQSCFANQTTCMQMWPFLQHFSYTLHLYTHQMTDVACNFRKTHGNKCSLDAEIFGGHANASAGVGLGKLPTASDRSSLFAVALSAFQVLANRTVLSSSSSHLGVLPSDFHVESQRHNFFVSQHTLRLGSCDSSRNAYTRTVDDSRLQHGPVSNSLNGVLFVQDFNWCLSSGGVAVGNYRLQSAIPRNTWSGRGRATASSHVVVTFGRTDVEVHDKNLLSGKQSGTVTLETTLPCLERECSVDFHFCAEADAPEWQQSSSDFLQSPHGLVIVVIFVPLWTRSAEERQPKPLDSAFVAGRGLRICLASNVLALKGVDSLNCHRFEIVPAWDHLQSHRVGHPRGESCSKSIGAWTRLKLDAKTITFPGMDSSKQLAAVQFQVVMRQPSKLWVKGHMAADSRTRSVIDHSHPTFAASSEALAQMQWETVSGNATERGNHRPGKFVTGSTVSDSVVQCDPESECVVSPEDGSSLKVELQCNAQRLDVEFALESKATVRRLQPFVLVVRDPSTNRAAQLCFNFRQWHKDCMSVEFVVPNIWVRRSLDFVAIFGGSVLEPVIEVLINPSISAQTAGSDVEKVYPRLYFRGNVYPAADNTRPCRPVVSDSCASVSANVLQQPDIDDLMEPSVGTAGHRFYLYTGDAFDFEECLACYSRLHNGRNILTHETRDTVQSTANILLRRDLETHPLRTRDPAQASVFVVAVYSVTSWKVQSNAMARLTTVAKDEGELGEQVSSNGVHGIQRIAGVASCGGLTHSERMERVRKAVQDSPWFQRHAGRDHLIVCQSHNCKSALGTALPRLLRNGWIAINERNPEWASWSCSRRMIVIPYVCNTEIARALRQINFQSTTGNVKRTKDNESVSSSVYGTNEPFHDCVQMQCKLRDSSALRGSGSGGVEQRHDGCGPFPSTGWKRWAPVVACKDVRVTFIGTVRDEVFDPQSGVVLHRNSTALRWHIGQLAEAWSNEKGVGGAPPLTHINLLSSANQFHAQEQATRYAYAMLRSEFCLVPAGDTPTSRRLFDAIKALCVPVIISDGIGPSLPFSWKLNYSSFAFFLSERAFVSDPIREIERLYERAQTRVVVEGQMGSQPTTHLRLKQAKLAQVRHATHMVTPVARASSGCVKV